MPEETRREEKHGPDEGKQTFDGRGRETERKGDEPDDGRENEGDEGLPHVAG